MRELGKIFPSPQGWTLALLDAHFDRFAARSGVERAHIVVRIVDGELHLFANDVDCAT